MAQNEKELYKQWKEKTLLANSEQYSYRIWDYPIKNLYTNVFKSIQDSMPIRSSREGFDKVLKSEDGSFALIHDASQVCSKLFF